MQTKDFTNIVNTLQVTFLSASIMLVLGACSTSTETDQYAKNEDNSQQQVENELAEVSVQKNAQAFEMKRQHLDSISMAMPIIAERREQEAYHAQPNREKYQHMVENQVKRVAQQPVSTFSIDVDTGSYSNSRRMLNNGVLPPSDAVRLEEFINYFDYQYAVPENNEQPFDIDSVVSVAPWNKERHLMRIGLKGFESKTIVNKGSNLVFLLDVSGSMDQVNKLPLLKKSLRMLTSQLTDKDSVSIVVYAGASGVVLEPTRGNNKSGILQALDKLQAGGSTNGASGIELAYQLAQQHFIKEGVNRVILATDGDFNVGISDHNQLIDLIKRKKEHGIALTTLGFGQGNYNDHLMEQLADAGNGNYAYIDTLNEARKVLVDEMQSTLHMIAKDVKIQVEFNPAQVSEYRLIGYENRQLDQEDFNNDKVDAGDVGAGHTVTAFYELTLTNSKDKFIAPLRYQGQAMRDDLTPVEGEIAHIKLRYKHPQGNKSKLIDRTVDLTQISKFDEQSADFRFATAVVGFGQLLKQSKFRLNSDYTDIINLANEAKGTDKFGYRAEFIQLVRTAKILSEQHSRNDSIEHKEPTSELTVLLDNHNAKLVP